MLSIDDRRIIELLAVGMTRAEVAAEIGVKTPALHKRIERLFVAVGVQTTVQLVVWAIAQTWIPDAREIAKRW